MSYTILGWNNEEKFPVTENHKNGRIILNTARTIYSWKKDNT